MSKLVMIRREKHAIGQVDEHISLATIRNECPTFFRSKTGYRETYTMYRGQLIVRGSVKFTGCRQERKTCVYLYFVDGEMPQDTLCVSAGNEVYTVAQAKKLIDKVLDTGTYCWSV